MLDRPKCGQFLPRLSDLKIAPAAKLDILSTTRNRINNFDVQNMCGKQLSAGPAAKYQNDNGSCELIASPVARSRYVCKNGGLPR